MNRNIFIWLIKSTLLHNTVADNIITKGIQLWKKIIVNILNWIKRVVSKSNVFYFRFEWNQLMSKNCKYKLSPYVLFILYHNKSIKILLPINCF